MVPETGLDFLKWFTGSMARFEEVRRDLPKFASPDDKRAYFDSLLDLILGEWKASAPAAHGLSSDSFRLMEEFLRERDSGFTPKHEVTLPRSASPTIPELKADSRVRLDASPRLALRPEVAGNCSFRAGNETWKCTAGMSRALESLSGSAWSRVGDLRAMVEDPADSHRLLLLLSAMTVSGVLVAE